jgi:aldehyde dehydrogenase (NAD+)
MNRNMQQTLKRLGLEQPRALASGRRWIEGRGMIDTVTSPVDGSVLAEFKLALPDQVPELTEHALEAFHRWRCVPAPKRGELVRMFGEVLRRHKADLARVVTWEVGKILQESLGEVQEMIDMCDFAVGLSRQLYGLTIASERPEHRLMEQWHPLGPIGVITAFNFPVAVWAWNAMLALVCGDPVVWKPSEKTPLTAMVCHHLLMDVATELADVPEAISSLAIGPAEIGQAIASDARLPLISATGSVPMGRAVGVAVAQRLGRSLLELSGNNGLIVAPSADLDLAVRAIVFAAVGTCGQRCTTLRRLIVHESLCDDLAQRLIRVYQNLPIGDPFEPETLVGPLIDERALAAMESAITTAQEQGGKLLVGGKRIRKGLPGLGIYVQPAIIEIQPEAEIVRRETFAPILYLMRYTHCDDAISIMNSVPQGLASAVFTGDVREAERFCGPAGSDCGIANVNIGTSGAEIGGAFGGEKETGGGRESGSDAWKAYMRRATNTINYSRELPLAQGIRFDVQ